jgi:hypothetical protein
MGYGIRFDIRGVKYDLNLTGRVSVIEGNSGTGKTMFAYDIAMYMAYKKQIGKVTVYNYSNRFNCGQTGGKGRIIIIDNADIQLGSKEIEAINKDEGNQYIIFARGILGGLEVELSDNYEFEFDGEYIKAKKVIKED